MMNEYNNKKLTDINDVVRFLKQSPQNPYYDFDTDYTTNSPNYYDYLAKLKPLIQILAERIYDYDKILASKLKELSDTMDDYMKEFDFRLDEWDKRLLAFDDEIERLLREWIDDGTFADIINEEIFNFKLDRTSFEEVIVNVLDHNVKGDGRTNDTKGIQHAINRFNTIYFPKGEYLFDRLNIPSNKKIIFDPEAILKSNYDLNESDQGIIQLEGKTFGMFNVLEDINKRSRVIKVSATSALSFKKNDMIELSQDRAFAADSSVTNYKEHEQQHAYSVLTIKSVNYDNGEIEVYEKIPYNYKVIYKTVIKKVIPVENVTIEGQNTEFDRMGITTPGDYVALKYTRHVTIRGLKCRNGSGKSIGIYNSHHFYLDDIQHGEITSTKVALGEGIIINKSGNGIIEKCKIFDTKRGIDFANGWDTSVNNCRAYDSRMTTHGLFSTGIQFNQCLIHADNLSDNQSAFTFGNMSYLSDEYITINDCIVYGGRYAVHALTESNNITINNLKIYGSDVGFSFNNDAHNIYINNCEKQGGRTTITLDDSNHIYFKNFMIDEPTNNSDVGSFRIERSHDIYFDNLKYKGNRVVFMTTENIEKLDVYNVEIINSSIDLGKLGIRLLNVAINHFKIFNLETNSQIRITGEHDIFILNSKFTKWSNIENTIKYNTIIKDNILTEVNGNKPEYPFEDTSNNVIVSNNIFLKNRG